MITDRKVVEEVDRILAEVRIELLGERWLNGKQGALERFGAMHSAHEGYAVIKEEVDELWDEVKANAMGPAISEARQVAAMGVRFILDLSEEISSDV